MWTGTSRAASLAETVIELAGRRIAIRHLLYVGKKLTKEGRAFLERVRPDVCVFCHTHQPKTEWVGTTLLFNPGSAGPIRSGTRCRFCATGEGRGVWGSSRSRTVTWSQS